MERSLAPRSDGRAQRPRRPSSACGNVALARHSAELPRAGPRRLVPSLRSGHTFFDLPEAQILQRAQGGDRDAIEFLLRKYSRLARAKLKSYFLLGADREDLLQVGMVGLWEAIMDYRPSREVSFRCFAQMCIQRELISAIKFANRSRQSPLNTSVSLDFRRTDEPQEKSLADAIPSGWSADPEAVWAEHEAVAALQQTLRERLSRFEYRVFKTFTEGRSYREAAQMLGVTEKSIDNALARIRRKLAKWVAVSRRKEPREASPACRGR